MKEVISILVAIVGVFATLGGVVLTFYLANRLALNDSMDSKSGWRKELMDIASKDEITLADIYRIRASVRYYPYPYSETNQLSFRWMSSLIINLCDEYFVETYRDKHVVSYRYDNSSNSQPSVNVLSENDEIVRIICRYLLKVHWEQRQKMVIFRWGRDLMNIGDDNPREVAARTIRLISNQVYKMNNKTRANNIQVLKRQLNKAFEEGKYCGNCIKF